MPKAYKPLVILFIAFLVVMGFSLFRTQGEPVNFEAAKAESARTGKPLLAYFTATWCGPCQRMKKTTFADAAVKEVLKDYVVATIDIDANPGLATQFRVEGIPRFVMMTPEGKTISIAEGYMGPGEMISFLSQPRVIVSTRPATRP